MTEVAKYGVVLPVSEAALREGFDLEAALRANAALTPEQREANIARAKRERAEVRKLQGVSYGTTDPIAAVEDRMGWRQGYVQHLAQPYCECFDGHDGWEYCEHAADLGLRPW